MGRRAVGLAVALLVLSAACGGSGEPGTATTPADPETAPDVVAGPATTEESPAPGATAQQEPGEGASEVTAWFVRSGADRLWVEPVRVPLNEPTVGVAGAAMEVLVSSDPADPGLVTLAPGGTRVLGVDLDGALLTVDLSGEVRQGGGAASEEAFAQQLAYTGTQFPNVEEVRVLVDGEPVTELWGHLDWSAPLVREPFAESPVVIDEPGWRQEIGPGSVTVRGTANVFEATVALRVLLPDGNVAYDTITTATCGTGCRGTWEHTFEQLTLPGIWVIEAAETDPSDGEGRPPFVARTEIVVG